MSFESMKVAELREVADAFGVDLGAAKAKGAVIKELDASGVTFEDYQSLSAAQRAADDDVEVQTPVAVKAVSPPPEDGVVIRMTRANPTFEIMGLRFTREHPYAIASAATADFIFDSQEGFRPATPRELQEYYS